MKMDRRVWLQKHILAMVYVMGILFGVMVLRYAWLQLVAGDELSERMRSQVGYDLAIQSPRGTITDRNGREMAVSLMTKSLYIDPNHVSDPDALATDLAPLINMPEQEILDDISAVGGFVWVKRRMEHDEYEAVRKMVREKSYTDCVGFRDEAKRYYPNDILGANVLGFVGTDDKGLDGIEQGLDGLLKGEVKEKYLTTDRQNRPILDSIFSSQRQYKGEYCKNVELTLDAGIQFIVEQELDRAMAENNPQAITCVVMNPKTGEVLAMASRPSYNPNSFYDYSPEVWKNRAVSFIYEPGSTFKSVVVAAALQEKVVSPNQATSWFRGDASRTGAARASAPSPSPTSSSSRSTRALRRSACASARRSSRTTPSSSASERRRASSCRARRAACSSTQMTCATRTSRRWPSARVSL